MLGQWAKENKNTLIAAGCVAAISAALAPIIMPALLGAVGFSAGGVVAGSVAASIQASIGSVAAGSLFALCQTVGTGAALPLIGHLASVGLGLSAGLLAKVVAFLLRKLVEGGLEKINARFWDLINDAAEFLSRRHNAVGSGASTLSLGASVDNASVTNESV
jgi:hypothetical protein